MVLNDKGIQLIKSCEGCKLHAYYDAVGIPTIGYGHCGPEVHIGQVITQERANNLLYTDLLEFSNGVKTLIAVPLTDDQFSALVSFAYNVGLGTFKHSSVCQKINEKDFDGAMVSLLKYHLAGGKVLAGLVTRRQKEKDLFNGIA